jgi:hypothetical protein
MDFKGADAAGNKAYADGIGGIMPLWYLTGFLF